MRPSPSKPGPAVTETESEAPDLGGDTIERALRLGTTAVGCPLVFTLAGSILDAGGRRSAALPARSFEELRTVRGDAGEPLGTVRAIDLAARPPLDWDARHALTDVSALIGADLVAHQRLGETDHVTGMPNRRRFEREFKRMAQTAGQAPVLLLVTLGDARKYGDILRALGHACAESFVRSGAAKICAFAGPSTLVCHVSVLSFAFFVEGARGERFAKEMLELFADPVMCSTLPITTRIGVGLSPVDILTARPSEALRSALAAAQDSRVGDRGYAFYDPKIDAAHARSFRLLTDLDEALRDYGQLSLAYQPRIDLGTGRTVGAEALARWTHPLLGTVAPSEFIPLAEATALIDPLTDFVMTRACRQAAAWRRDGLDLRVSVNVSPTSLNDAEFLDRVDRIIETSRVDPTALEFEVTEGAFTSFDPGVRERIDGVRARGVRVAIDDFGTGYSNLDALTRLPADVLKIDRSLVQSIDGDARRRRLCHAMIELAQDLDFHVVAEGIETCEVYDILAEWGCGEGQGYFMSRPLPAADFAAFVAAG